MAYLSLAAAKVKVLKAPVTITGAVLSGGHLQITGTHSFEVGDIVQISGVGGAVEANIQGVVSSVSTTVSFKLENTPYAVTSYTSGGIATHIGWATPTGLIDNTVFATTSDVTLQARVEALTVGNARVHFVDSADSGFVTAQPLETFQVAGPVAANLSADIMSSARKYQVPGLRIGASGDNVRVLLFLDGGTGASAQFSAWLAY